jgi:hypothetical protein
VKVVSVYVNVVFPLTVKLVNTPVKAELVALSIVKPVTVGSVLAQVRVTLFGPFTVAARVVGAAGGVEAVTVAVGADAPAAVTAVT